MAKLPILGVLLSVLLACFLYSPSVDVVVPEETWWCPENKGKVDDSVRPFRVTFSEEMVTDLRQRLARTRKMTEPLSGVGWTYGISGSKFKPVLDYWAARYDFKARETRLNRYPQFLTNIQGLDVHFLRVKPENPGNKKVVPLLLVHGWPGSVVEFYQMIPLLTTPRPGYNFVFEVVAPSLPGFAFSSAATIPGLGARQMSVVFKNLMLRLGHESWYTQGGDWGSLITAEMAAMYPERVRALHSNMCLVMSPWANFKTMLYSFVPSLVTTEETYHLMFPLKKHWSMLLAESGYFHIQATRPDTIGVALNDSPAGLAAYILEKFARWSDANTLLKPDNKISNFDLDELLDNLMMYWVPNSSTTAARIYAETGLANPQYHVKVPSYCAQFPNEIMYQPPQILKERYKDLRKAKLMPRGGHFAAFEEPGLLADDIFDSFDEIENPKAPSKKTV